jgi:hypothetical protein
MNRKNSTIFVLLFFTVFSSFAQKDTSKIQGTWKLISLKQGDKVINISSDDSIQRIKYITQSNFVWIQYLKSTKIVRNSAGGAYTYDGSKYIENYNFVGCGSLDFLNRKHTFNVTVNGDKLYLTGKLYSSHSDSIKIDEIWKRIDKSKESQIAVISPVKPE